jgi:hypothetical protein
MADGEERELLILVATDCERMAEQIEMNPPLT